MTTSIDTTTTTSPVILTGPENWRKWLDQARKYAQEREVWQYVDPTTTGLLPILQKPVVPDILAYYTEADRTAYTEALAAHQQDPNQQAPVLSRMKIPNARLQVYKLDLDEYHATKKEYDLQAKALAQLRQWVNTNISVRNRAYIEDFASLAEELRELQARNAPTDYAAERQAIADYHTVLRISNNTSIMAWLDRWETVLREGLRLNLPETTGSRPVYDFVRAVRTYHPAFADYEEGQLDRDIAKDGTISLDGYKIAKIFRDRIRREKAGIDLSKASFTLFHDQTNDQTNGQTNGHANRLTTSQPDHPPKCPCGKYHFFDDCEYVIQAPGWTPDPAIQAKFEEVFEERDSIRKAFEAARQRVIEKEAPDIIVKDNEPPTGA